MFGVAQGQWKVRWLVSLVFSLFTTLTIAPVLLVASSLVVGPEAALAQDAALEQAIQRHLTAQGPVAKQKAPIMADLDGDGKEEAVLYYCIDRNVGSASNPANSFCEFAVFHERNGAWAPAARVRLGQGNVQGEVGVQGGVIEAKTLTRGQQVTRRYGVRSGRLVELTGRDTSEPAAARGSSQFATSIADVRTSTQGSIRYVALTLRFQNKGQRPLTLGYVQGSGLITDDRGNRYQLSGPIRGLGEIKPGAFDSKFTLHPGESGDARLEFAWSGSGNQIFGTVYELGLAVREIVPIAGSQWQLGQEHTLRFADLRGDTAVAAAPSSPAPVSPPAPGGPAETDPCSGKPRCYGAGPFAAEVTRVTTSKTGSYQIVQLNVKFRNLTDQPLVLCYASESALGTDDRGNRYSVRDDRGVKGIGLCRGNVADPQFALKPGQSGDVAFEYFTYTNVANFILGTVYSANFTIKQLEILPGNQTKTAREYAVSFRDLSAGSAPAVASAPNPTDSAGSSGPRVDVCAGQPRCYSSGPFVAEVTRVATSKTGSYQLVQLNMKFRNLSDQPLVLCYASESAVGTDDRGNRYSVRDDRGVKGIGLCRGTAGDPQFALKPAQSREAIFEYYLYTNVDKMVVGTTYTANLTVKQLELLPANQIRSIRDFAVSFANLKETATDAASSKAEEALKGLIKKLPTR
jgi:hypothetical protein